MRVKGSTPTRDRRKRVLKQAKGYFGSKHLLFRTAHEQVMHSLRYSWIDRRKLKREMRKLWIARINAGARINDMSYSQLMHGLKIANVTINRKMLSEIAIHDPEGFKSICETAKKAIKEGPKAIVVEEAPAEEKKAPAKKAAAPKAEKEEKPAAKKAPAKKAEKPAAEKKPAAKKAPAKKAAKAE